MHDTDKIPSLAVFLVAATVYGTVALTVLVALDAVIRSIVGACR